MARHEINIRLLLKKYNGYTVSQMKTERLKEDVYNLEQNLQIITPEPLSHVQAKPELNDPASMLRDLVFAYLDHIDLAQPVCKLWTQLGEYKALWKSLYQIRFDTALSPLQDTEPLQWKSLFRSALVASNRVRGQRDNFGWPIHICPVVGCNKELRSKLDYDVHILKHEFQDVTERLNVLRRDQKRRAQKSV